MVKSKTTGAVSIAEICYHIFRTGQEYPVWVFLEVITFGRFLSILKVLTLIISMMIASEMIIT